MCDRYSISVLPSDLDLWLHVKVPDDYKPRFNAAPTQYLPIITNYNTKEIIMGRWGFISKISGNKDISSKLFHKPIDSFMSGNLWRKILVNNRCLILADGFYCWKEVGKKQKVAFRIVPRNKKIFCFAGIWEVSEDFDTGYKNISFIIITKSSYKPVNEISETMPVIIEPGKELQWLNTSLILEEVIYNMDIEDWALLKYYSVSPKIHDITLDNPDLIKPAPTSDQFGNYTLFD